MPIDQNPEGVEAIIDRNPLRMREGLSAIREVQANQWPGYAKLEDHALNADAFAKILKEEGPAKAERLVIHYKNYILPGAIGREHEGKIMKDERIPETMRHGVAGTASFAEPRFDAEKIEDKLEASPRERLISDIHRSGPGPNDVPQFVRLYANAKNPVLAEKIKAYEANRNLLIQATRGLQGDQKSIWVEERGLDSDEQKVFVASLRESVLNTDENAKEAAYRKAVDTVITARAEKYAGTFEKQKTLLKDILKSVQEMEERDPGFIQSRDALEELQAEAQKRQKDLEQKMDKAVAEFKPEATA